MIASEGSVFDESLFDKFGSYSFNVSIFGAILAESLAIIYFLIYSKIANHLTHTRNVNLNAQCLNRLNLHIYVCTVATIDFCWLFWSPIML